MSWKDILKELSPRERMDAEDFAPEEMQEWEDEQRQARDSKKMQRLRLQLHKLEMWLRDGTTDEETHKLLTAMLARARKFVKANDVKSTERMFQSMVQMLRHEINSPFKRFKE